MANDFAVFSDIHGNHTAFQACIDYAMGKGITNFVLLGDFVTDCPYPQKTMELIYVLKQYFNTYIIRGNREEYLLNYKNSGAGNWRKGSASGSLLYTYENLTGKDFDFFESLPNYGMYQVKGMPGFEFCHGSPTNTSELLFREKRNTKKVLSHLKSGVLLHGHNHIQGTYMYRGKKAVNPGSIGIPWYYGGKTQFCILHGNGKAWEEEYIQLDYNRKEILREREDPNGVIVEDSSVESEHFALLFEFSGDQKATRHCLYYCSAARPNIEGKTVGETKKVQTEKLLIIDW